MTECEFKAAALGIMVYNHIVETNKKPSIENSEMELDVSEIDPTYFSKALRMLQNMKIDKLSMSVVGCPYAEGSC